MPARSPESVDIEWDAENKVLIAHPVTQYNNDLVYEWINSKTHQTFIVRDFNQFDPPVSGAYYVRVY